MCTFNIFWECNNSTKYLKLLSPLIKQMTTAMTLVPPPPPPTYNLSHYLTKWYTSISRREPHYTRHVLFLQENRYCLVVSLSLFVLRYIVSLLLAFILIIVTWFLDKLIYTCNMLSVYPTEYRINLSSIYNYTFYNNQILPFYTLCQNNC